MKKITVYVSLEFQAEFLDMDFQKTFLMTYQSFTTSERFLRKLIQRYHAPPSHGNAFPLRTVNVMKKWIGGQATDLNEQIIETFKLFLEKHLKNDSPALYKQLQKELLKKVLYLLSFVLNLQLNDENEIKKQLVFNAPPPEPKVFIIIGSC